VKLLFILITFFIVGCTSVKTQTVDKSQKQCLETLELNKREYLFDETFEVNKLNRKPFTIVKETINDSIDLGLLSIAHKNKLINAIHKVTFINSDGLKTVHPSNTKCGLFFNNKSSASSLNIDPDFNFFMPDGFVTKKEKNKEASILQKYIDSSSTLFESEPFYVDKGSYFKLNKTESQYLLKIYETYSNDGGEFLTTYKISNILDYNTDAWLNSIMIHRSFFKQYFSEQKKFINSQEDETLDIVWQYTYLETKLDKSNSYIESINLYYLELDNSNLSEKLVFSIKKQILHFNPTK